MVGEGRVEHIREGLLRSAAILLVLRPSERHAEIEVGCDRKRRSGVRHGFVRPRAERVEAPAGEPCRGRGAPAFDAAIFARAGLGVGNALRALVLVGAEIDVIDTHGQEAPALGIDQPGYAGMLGKAEAAARAEPAVGHAAPERLLNPAVHARRVPQARRRTLDLSQYSDAVFPTRRRPAIAPVSDIEVEARAECLIAAAASAFCWPTLAARMPASPRSTARNSGPWRTSPRPGTGSSPTRCAPISPPPAAASTRRCWRSPASSRTRAARCPTIPGRS